VNILDPIQGNIIPNKKTGVYEGAIKHETYTKIMYILKVERLDVGKTPCSTFV